MTNFVTVCKQLALCSMLAILAGALVECARPDKPQPAAVELQ